MRGDQVRGGPCWSEDPAFSGGVGVRGRISDALSAGAEYRIGWELHQRLSGIVEIGW